MIGAKICGLVALLGASGLVAEARVYGDSMPVGDAHSIEAALVDPQSFGGRLAKFHGRITEVCQKKGCWAILTDGTTAVRVKFEDHDNALPFAAEGSAVVYGRWQTKQISEKLAKHYAMDAGADSQSARAGMEYQILARSIQLLDEPSSNPEP